MPEFLIEHGNQCEVGYVSEAKENIFVMKSRLYAEAQQQYRAYRHRPIKHVRMRLRPSRRQDNLQTSARRRQRPSLEVSAPSFPNGVLLAVQKMIELLELPQGWNSYNARPITKENVNFALDVLAHTMRADTPVPNVIPMVRGGVQLEWHTRGIDLEISIYSPTELKFVAEEVGSGADPVEGEFDLASLRRWIGKLSGQK